VSYEWKHGQKAELARAAGVSPAYLGDILKGRRRATPENAILLSNAAREMGLSLDRLDLIYPHESTNPLIEVCG